MSASWRSRSRRLARRRIHGLGSSHGAPSPPTQLRSHPVTSHGPPRADAERAGPDPSLRRPDAHLDREVPARDRRPAGGVRHARSSSWPTATRSSCASRRWPSASATRRCGCSPTTARSPARRCGCAQGSEVVVDVENEGDLEATVHWHGLRLENRYDGTHETQDADPGRRRASPPASRSPTPACTGTTRTSARTTARRWASTATSSSSPPTPTTGRRCTARSRSPSTTSSSRTARSRRSAATETTYAAMGRFGNVLLVGGEPDLALTAQAGEVVRLYLTNTANTRVFNVALPGARMKLVGGDSGRSSTRSSSTTSCWRRRSGRRRRAVRRRRAS